MRRAQVRSGANHPREAWQKRRLHRLISYSKLTDADGEYKLETRALAGHSRGLQVSMKATSTLSEKCYGLVGCSEQ